MYVNNIFFKYTLNNIQKLIMIHRYKICYFILLLLITIFFYYKIGYKKSVFHFRFDFSSNPFMNWILFNFIHFLCYIIVLIRTRKGNKNYITSSNIFVETIPWFFITLMDFGHFLVFTFVVLYNWISKE